MNLELSQYIDHTNLKPTATEIDIKKLCAEAIEHNFKAVCVSPYYVELAVKELQKEDPLICTVVGFPIGYDHLSSKTTSVKKSIDQGADELDAVVNIAAVKNSEWSKIEAEIESLATIVKMKSSKILKLILETAYLTDEELKILCNLCVQYDVDFAKTSTGMAPKGAEVGVVARMQQYLESKVKIKASGGIRDREFAMDLINAGANRLGTSSGIKLIEQK